MACDFVKTKTKIKIKNREFAVYNLKLINNNTINGEKIIAINRIRYNDI